MNQPFSKIIGNNHVKGYLTNMFNKQVVGNSLLFTGPQGIGKSLFVDEFAKLILKTDDLTNHPDYYVYRPEGKLGLHSIDSMRQMCEKVYLAPFSSGKKVFVIHHAEKMLPTSANSLLKTFEEPSSDTIMILLTSQIGAILPTVLSRCRIIRFHELQLKEIQDYLMKEHDVKGDEAEKIAILSSGSIGKALRILKIESDHIRNLLLDLFKAGKVKHYSDLVNAAKNIADLVEEVKIQEEKLINKSLKEGFNQDLTALQTQNINKEIEGAIAVRQSEFLQSIFEVILSWVRDLHLLKHGGNPNLLMNIDQLDALKMALKQKPLPSIESIQKMIQEAKILYERSTSLNIVLENLFLKLGFI